MGSSLPFRVRCRMMSMQNKTMPFDPASAVEPLWKQVIRYLFIIGCGGAAVLLAGLAWGMPETTPPILTKRALLVQAPRITPTIPPTATPVPTVVVPVSLPEAVRLEVPNRKQERTLNCELRSATDLAEYYGQRFTWEALFAQVGYDPNGDPNVGFVGRSIDDPSGGIYPNGYGVHAEPIARGLRGMGLDAIAHRGQSRAWLQTTLAAGHPVIVWATGGLDPSRRVEWQTRDGQTVWGVPFEHTFTAIGYDQDGIWLNDPFGGTTDYYPWATFETAWALLDHMAVTIQE
jgi:uncharacterized protein YvpB